MVTGTASASGSMVGSGSGGETMVKDFQLKFALVELIQSNDFVGNVVNQRWQQTEWGREILPY